jgi:chaperonin GroES
MAKTAKKKSKKVVAKKSAKKAAPAVKKSSAKKAASKKPTPQKTIAAKKAKTATSLGKSTKTDLSQFISPLDDRVLVQTEEGEKITAGGIIIPDTSDITGNMKAIVVAVGRGHRDLKGRLRPLDLKIGDRVLLPEHAGDSIQVLNTKVKILRESEILGILEK